MRICHFTSSSVDYPYFRNIAHGLRDRGHAVTLATIGPHPPPDWLDGDHGLSYLALGASRRVQYPGACARLARWLRRNQIDVVQVHLFDGSAVGIPASSLAKTPARILMRHHMDQHAVLGRPVHSRIDSLIARTADHVIVPSQAVGDYLQDHEGVRGDSITVCPLGFDFSVLERSAAMGPQLRGELGLNDAFLVGYVGRLVPEKGVDSLLRAVTELRPDHPQLRILLVGEEPGGWLQPEIRSLGLSDEVTVLGHRPDGPAYIAALDLLVHPSLTDSFPQTLIEAQAVGTPVVATTVGGIPEIVTHDLTGLLVRPDEPAELAQAIRCLAADALQRERLATTAQKHAREAFPVERMVSDHLSVYLKCIAGK